ncbi:fibrous sheath CABYR-binding protein [Meriones unguiculatus]|uniref:fibrous sheath CABYR-binding protein n=1 Tax=Meriones unguiculatus TaxID=10047 RepID=UPI00293E9259|nr:fibrous sheath CABYR-binding protein [Meriones unguiculatus]
MEESDEQPISLGKQEIRRRRRPSQPMVDKSQQTEATEKKKPTAVVQLPAPKGTFSIDNISGSKSTYSAKEYEPVRLSSQLQKTWVKRKCGQIVTDKSLQTDTAVEEKLEVIFIDKSLTLEENPETAPELPLSVRNAEIPTSRTCTHLTDKSQQTSCTGDWSVVNICPKAKTDKEQQTYFSELEITVMSMPGSSLSKPKEEVVPVEIKASLEIDVLSTEKVSNAMMSFTEGEISAEFQALPADEATAKAMLFLTEEMPSLIPSPLEETSAVETDTSTMRVAVKIQPPSNVELHSVQSSLSMQEALAREPSDQQNPEDVKVAPSELSTEVLVPFTEEVLGNIQASAVESLCEETLGSVEPTPGDVQPPPSDDACSEVLYGLESPPDKQSVEEDSAEVVPLLNEELPTDEVFAGGQPPSTEDALEEVCSAEEVLPPPTEDEPEEETCAEIQALPAEEAPGEETPAESPPPQTEESPAEAPCPPAEEIPVEAPCPPAEEIPAEAPCPPAEEIPAEAPCPPAEEIPAEAPCPPAEEIPAEAPCPPAEEIPAEAPCPPAEKIPEEAPSPPAEEILAEAPCPPAEKISEEAPCPPAEEIPAEAPCPPAEEIPAEAPCPPAEEIPAEAPCPPAEKILAEAPCPPAEKIPEEAPCPPAEEIPEEAPSPPAEEIPAEAPCPPAEEIPAEAPSPPAEEIPTEAPPPPAEASPVEVLSLSGKSSAEEASAEVQPSSLEGVHLEGIPLEKEVVILQAEEIPLEDLSEDVQPLPLEKENVAEGIPVELYALQVEEYPAGETTVEGQPSSFEGAPTEDPLTEAPLPAAEASPAEETPIEEAPAEVQSLLAEEVFTEVVTMEDAPASEAGSPSSEGAPTEEAQLTSAEEIPGKPSADVQPPPPETPAEESPVVKQPSKTDVVPTQELPVEEKPADDPLPPSVQTPKDKDLPKDAEVSSISDKELDPATSTGGKTRETPGVSRKKDDQFSTFKIEGTIKIELKSSIS